MGANKAYFDLKDKNRTSVYEWQASIQIFVALSLITMRYLMIHIDFRALRFEILVSWTSIASKKALWA